MTDGAHSPRVGQSVLKPDHPVGIAGYGAYVPRYRLPGREVARVWTGGLSGSPVQEKAVAGLDEDVITMSIEAAQNALARAAIDPRLIRAVWVGSESHPYAVKPTSTVVAESIGAAPNVQAADWEFACKAGSEAMQAGIGFVGSGMGGYAPTIGMDTAQARPGDAREYTAAAGGAAFIIRPAAESVAVFQGSYSYVTDTPDFWRRARQIYPSHGDRFTGEPAYFKHVTGAAERLMELLALRNGQLLNQSELARDAGVSQATAHRYIALLETSYMFARLPAYTGNRTTSLVKSPKAHWNDPGLALFLAGIYDESSLRSARELGAAFETWVFHHLRVLAFHAKRLSVCRTVDHAV